MNYLIYAFLFFLPAGIANMAPVLVSKMPGLRDWNYPLDNYTKFNGKRLLGDHKTWRGLLSGVIVGMLVAWVEVRIIGGIGVFREVNPLVLGGLMGLGALVGDSVKSFFKRQLGIKSGQSWFPFDQIDYIIGGIIFILPIIVLSWHIYLTIFIIYFLLHLLVSFLGYLLKFKSSPI